MATRLRNGRCGSLEAAMALLLQTQVQQAHEMIGLRKDIEEIKQMLIRRERVLAGLTDAIREKIGFKK